jgi:flagellar protein FlbT
MALKISLKPGEKLIAGTAVITNGKTKADFIIENNVPLLRERDIMTEKQADTFCRKIYFVVQMMYIDEKNLVAYHKTYWDLIGDLLSALPRLKSQAQQMSGLILEGKYYQAIKEARKLVNYEEEVLKNVRSST